VPQVDDERDPVTVVDDGPTPKPPRHGALAELLEAVRDLPDAVAARIDGSPHQTSGSGAPEVTFVGDPLPEPDADPEQTPVGPGNPQPDPEVRRPRFGHPAARRKTTEAIV
jgi:hypothetical protein